MQEAKKTDEPWWWVEAKKHPGCWIAVLRSEHRIVASSDPEVARAAADANPDETRFIFWSPLPPEDGVIEVGI